MRYRLAALVIFLVASGWTASGNGRALAAKEQMPPRSSVEVTDVPWDDGTQLKITWAPQDTSAHRAVVLRHGPGSTVDTVGIIQVSEGVSRGSATIVDAGLAPGEDYTYTLIPLGRAGVTSGASVISHPMAPRANWFNRGKLGEGILILILFAVILHGTFRIRELFVRPIGGLQAMEEALGRAVEMGKPALFSAGWGAQLDKPTTMAAMNIFGWVAGKSAEYGARLTFPTHDAVIMAAAQESASDAAQLVGRPEWYREDDIYYVTGSQFGYAAALDGVMERERPAANLWLGTFAAEALILSETGNHIGAMQIAGTDSTIQLAFFLVTCDYTLIGEEVFAASGYLTHDPKVLGGLWAQDMFKIIAAAALAAGLIGAALGWDLIGNWLKGI